MKNLIPAALVAAILVLTWLSGSQHVAYGVAAAIILGALVLVLRQRRQASKTAKPAETGGSPAAAGIKGAIELMKQGDDLRAQGKFDEAIEAYKQGRQLAEDARGPHNGIAFLLGFAIRQAEEERQAVRTGKASRPIDS